MLTLRFVASIFPVALIGLGPGAVCGQNYPSKPIRIVTAGAGGGNDFSARLIAQGISGPLGQPVIVENRQNGTIAAEAVAKAPPDGYTLLLAGGGFMFAPLLRPTPYDPLRDFSPITTTAKASSVLVVHPSVPAKSVKELVALAKAKPADLNYSFSGFAGATQVVAELFKSRAGINMIGINYTSSARGLSALMSGETQVMFSDAAAVAPHVKSGRLRALAVTSPEPSLMAPGLPTVASTVPGVVSVGIDGMWAPGNTPDVIIRRLNQESVRFLHTADAKEKLFNAGSEVVGNSPEELAATMKSDIATWAKVIKDAGIKVQ